MARSAALDWRHSVRAFGARWSSADRQFRISSTAQARRRQAAQIAGSDAMVGAGQTGRAVRP
jgi:hypothetical protein